MKAHIVRQVDVKQTARVLQLGGMFDVPVTKKAHLEWDVSLPLDEKPWSIGLIVGPSGCGKSTIAQELFPDAYVKGFDWPADRSVLDAFPEDMSIKEITLLLSSVGFSSPPSWLRPFGVLSNGEQFRTMIARALCEYRDLCVVDEFTSVVDRTVAQIGSAAIAKTVRRRQSKFIAVTCHYDVEAWLDPDWLYEPATGKFHWRSLQGRPEIALTIYRVHHSEWRRFAPYHYLSADLNRSARCFVTLLEGRPVAFHSYLSFVGRLRDERRAVRVHRMVCAPDFQGVGIANAVGDRLAAMWAGLGYRVFIASGHPAVVRSLAHAKEWRMTRAPSRTNLDSSRRGREKHLRGTRASSRLTASFEYHGASLGRREAERQMNQVR